MEQSRPWKRQNLVLDIPSRQPEASSPEFVAIKMPPPPTTPSPTPKRVNFFFTPDSSAGKAQASPGPSSSSRGKPPKKSLFPKLSFKNRTSSDADKAESSALESMASSSAAREKPSIVRSLSLTKLFTPRINRTSSLPVTQLMDPNPEATPTESVTNTPSRTKKPSLTRNIARSLSVPANSKDKSIKRMDSFFRVIPATPRPKESDAIATASSPTIINPESEVADGGEDIAEEEAVCRICFVELCEGGDTFKLECSCKGELALAHQECAIKWFSIKGNKTCDICKQEVRNLSVTLLRVQSVRARHSSRTHQAETGGFRVWQEVPVLVIVSMLAYFCFLEQLLVGKLGTGAIAISLPFSCVLGLLSSMTASTMVKRRFVWVYASVQFGLVVVFAHVFYSLIHVQAVLCVLLATFAGLGVAMSGSSIIIEFLRWKRRWQASSVQAQTSQPIP